MKTNTHLQHLENLVFLEGVSGATKAVSILNTLTSMLSGEDVDNSLAVGVKWDGSPSIVVGHDPKDGKFFVATKSIFNKTPKLYKSIFDIKRDLKGSLSRVMETAFEYLEPIAPPSGIFQGDVLFTEDELQHHVIDKTLYLIFQTNAIVYGTSVNSPLASVLYPAHLGVVWHTSYTGEIGDLKATFCAPVTHLWNTDQRDVVMFDALHHFEDEMSVSVMPVFKSNYMRMLIGRVTSKLKAIYPSALNDLSHSPEIVREIMKTTNLLVRRGISPDLVSTISSPPGYREAVDPYVSRWDLKTFNNILELSRRIGTAKNTIIGSLNNVTRTIDTFFTTQDGMRRTENEGYVVVDRLDGTVVKLVNRQEFSHANFDPSIVKAWQHRID